MNKWSITRVYSLNAIDKVSIGDQIILFDFKRLRIITDWISAIDLKHFNVLTINCHKLRIARSLEKFQFRQFY